MFSGALTVFILLTTAFLLSIMVLVFSDFVSIVIVPDYLEPSCTYGFT
jgi:hypothetical protein